MNSSKMYIHLFDGFTIEYGGEVFNMRDYLSRQSLSLLEVLILQDQNNVSRDFLMELFWENSDNPLSSLKFNIFRLRKLLKEIHTFQDIEFIHTEKGGYRFQPEVETIVDTSLFEKEFAAIEKAASYDDNTSVHARIIIDLYDGGLYNDTEQLWFMQKVEYFRNVFLSVTDKLCAYYLRSAQYAELKSIALKAATLEPSVEENHFYYIQALISEGDYAAAYEYYQTSTRMLVSEYAISLSEKMKELYSDIIGNNEEKKNIEGITSYYKSKEISRGALYCDNTAFDYIYEISMRNAVRENLRYFLFIFEIKADGDDEKRLEKLLEKAKVSIQSSLRSGDVFTRLNRYQFLVLLLCRLEDDAYRIAQRVSSSFQGKVRNRKERLHYYIQNTNQ